MAAVYTDIIDAIITAINGMTVAGGFRYDYSNCNEYDHDEMTYPNVKFMDEGEAGRAVENEVINSYTADSEITFEVTVDNTVSPVDKALDYVVEDLKRLMEEEHDDLQIEGLVVADYLSSQKEYTNVRARPGKVLIDFNINYRVLKTNPSSTT